MYFIAEGVSLGAWESDRELRVGYDRVVHIRTNNCRGRKRERETIDGGREGEMSDGGREREMIDREREGERRLIERGRES